MNEYKPYDPPEISISLDEYLNLMGENKEVLSDYRSLAKDYAKLSKKYHALNDEYLSYKKFVNPGELSGE